MWSQMSQFPAGLFLKVCELFECFAFGNSVYQQSCTEDFTLKNAIWASHKFEYHHCVVFEPSKYEGFSKLEQWFKSYSVKHKETDLLQSIRVKTWTSLHSIAQKRFNVKKKLNIFFINIYSYLYYYIVNTTVKFYFSFRYFILNDKFIHLFKLCF